MTTTGAHLLTPARPTGARKLGTTDDANGNRLTKTLNNSTDNYTYDDADKMTAAGAKTYTYDAAGRTSGVTVNNQTTTIAYDYENRITQITYPNSSTNTFTYNALDTRVGKVDSGGTKTYKRDGASVTDDVLADGASVFTPAVSVRNSGPTKFLHGDRLGTLSRETDGTQATTATKQYDAFGMPLSSTGTSVSPFGFAGGWGYQEDSDSGLKLLGHRYYDPSTGRFLTRDPAQDGRNWYAYCENGPLSWVDEAGLGKAWWLFFTPACCWAISNWLSTGDPWPKREVYNAACQAEHDTLLMNPPFPGQSHPVSAGFGHLGVGTLSFVINYVTGGSATTLGITTAVGGAVNHYIDKVNGVEGSFAGDYAGAAGPAGLANWAPGFQFWIRAVSGFVDELFVNAGMLGRRARALSSRWPAPARNAK